MIISFLTNFAGTVCSREPSFLRFPHWYEYLNRAYDPVTRHCEITNFQILHIPLILLALVDIALRLAALVSVAYIIYGGMLLVSSQGEEQNLRKGRQTIINALIGLGIAMLSIGFVTFIGARLGNI